MDFRDRQPGDVLADVTFAAVGSTPARRVKVFRGDSPSDHIVRVRVIVAGEKRPDNDTAYLHGSKPGMDADAWRRWGYPCRTAEDCPTCCAVAALGVVPSKLRHQAHQPTTDMVDIPDPEEVPA